MRGTMTKPEMKSRIPFLRELTYPERLEAEAIIDAGADVALLYFWFNLKKGHYRAHAGIDVNKQVDYYIARNPMFKTEILKWHHEYDNAKVRNS